MINTSRVLMGGLAAGAVLDAIDGYINSVLLADEWAAYMQSIGKAPAFAPMQIAGFIGIGMAIGIFMIWLYAALRPAFGPGPGTAVKAGFAVWVIGYLIPSITYVLVGLAPADLTFITTGIGLVQTSLAALAGAYVYKEK